MRVLVSGIGRSATTMLYQQISKMLRSEFKDDVKYRYEPYLWSLNSGYVKGSKFGMEDLSSKGIFTHKNTPLILSESHELHDEFLEGLYGDIMQEGDPAEPKAYLTKVIRGSGRLKSYLNKYPDLKILVCTRNPLDTINSSLGMFSFTGEEFHANDRERLVAEVHEHFPDLFPDLTPDATLMELSIAWWRVFTECSMQAAKEFPDNVYIMRHETFLDDVDTEIKNIVKFLDVADENMFRIGLDKPAGPKIGTTHLLNSDIHLLYPQLQYYLDECLKPVMNTRKLQGVEFDLMRKFADRQYHQQIAGDDMGRKSSIQLRGQILRGAPVANLYTPPAKGDNNRISVSDLVAKEDKARRLGQALYRSYASPSFRKNDKLTFGCVITSYNNSSTIRDTIFSVLDQTRPYDHVVVVDDGSHDGSRELLRSLEGRYKTLDIIYKNYNGGVSSSRQTGIAALNTDYITQLDGDDCFWPTKNREEAEIIFDTPDAIVFSNIMIDEAGGVHRIVDSSAYDADQAEVYAKMLRREPGIPRDMTFKKEYFEKIGGYDLRLDLYEDWDIKLRLANRIKAPWRLSNSIAGTIYNRKKPGLSGKDTLEHARALTHIFLKNVAESNHSIENVDKTYKIVINTHEREMTNITAKLLHRYANDSQKIKQFADKITSREYASMRPVLMRTELENILFNGLSGGPGWRPIAGFGHNVAPLKGIPQTTLFWVTEPVAEIACNTRKELTNITLQIYSPLLKSNKVTVSVDGPDGNRLCEKSVDITVPEKSEGEQPMIPLTMNCKIPPGEFTVKLKARDHVVEKVTTAGAKPAKLFFLLSSVSAAGTE